MLRSLLAFMAALTTLGALSQPAAAQRMDGNWEELGCVNVGFRPDQDIIEVGRREGTYKAIRLRAFNADIGIDDLRVIYGNGQPDNLRVRAVLRDREMTRPLDLEGRERFINRIEISTQKASRGRGRGRLCAYGLQNNDRRAGPRGPGGRPGSGPGPMHMQWEELGCVDVGRRPDMDSIDVGRREGTFKAIRLSAFGNDIDVRDLKVIYGNGQPDDIRVRSVLREGDNTRPLDLEGRERFIRRIDVVTNRSFRGRGRGPARLCAYGLQNDRRPDAGPRSGPGPHQGSRGFDRRGERDEGWEQLGCKKVSFIADHDTIPVGRREGRFRAIRLEAEDVSVEVIRVKVNYANGEPDVIPFRGKVTRGSYSPPLDLKGNRRSISSIELFQFAKLNVGKLNFLKGGATVCVSGLR